MNKDQFIEDASRVLYNMSLERTGYWRQLFRRWHISDEPLRHDAANCLRRHGIEFSLRPKGTHIVGEDQV